MKNNGIWLGGNVTLYDLDILIDIGINTIFLPNYGLKEMKAMESFISNNYKGIHTFIASVDSDEIWKYVVLQVNADYYYIDEPYNRGLTDSDIIIRRDYIKKNKPNSKLVIGDLRHILNKKYRPLEDVYYTYTSYISTWVIFGKPVKFGLPNQSRTIKRLASIVGKEKIPFVWLYGKNKILCHPDEFHKMTKMCNDLNIDTQLIYMHGTCENDEANVNREEQLEYIKYFVDGKKPYTIFSWWKRLFRSVKKLFAKKT